MRSAHLPIATLCLGAYIVAAQAPQSGPAPRPYAAATHPWPVINLNVLALDKQKLPLTETDPGAFQVLDDGVPQSILSLSGSATPVSLAVVVDLSGSTCPFQIKPNAACSSYDPALHSLVDLLASLPAGSEVMLVTFADKHYLNLKFAPVSEFKLQLFDTLRAQGGSAIYDALVATDYYFAKNARFKRRAIILLIDGEDNASHLNLEQAISRMSYASCPMLYAINTANEHRDTMSGSERRHSARALEILSEACGGIVVDAYGKKGSPEGAQAVAAAIRNQFALQYSSTNPAKDGKVHKLKITPPPNAGKVELHFVSEYPAPIP